MYKLIALLLCLPLVSSVALSQCNVEFSVVDPTCSGSFDGTVTFQFSNGVAPYNLEFAGASYDVPGNSITISDLAMGVYTATVTDAASCNVTTDVVVTEPPPLDAWVDVFPECNNEACIFVNVAGGTPPYSYAVIGLVTQDPWICQLWPGTYEVQIIDANGCQFLTVVDIWENIPSDVFITEEPVSCSTATLTAEVFGNPPTAYIWSTGENSQMITVNASGTYSVTILEIFGCESVAFYEYSGNNSGYTPDIQQITCNGDNDGAILSVPVPGFDPTSISWSGDNGFSSSELEISGLTAGVYSLTLEFADGCIENFGPYTIAEPNVLEVAASSVATSCNGGSDGAIDLTVIGGNGGFNFSWDAGLPGTVNQTGLVAGTYTVTITDGNGCSIIESITINEPLPITIDFTGTPESCLGDGSVTAMASGGSGSYSYAWSTGENTNSISNLVAGTYSVTVTDDNGCAFTNSYYIDSPIDLAVTSTFTSCNTDDGTATAEVLGGATMPTFAWSNGQTTATAIDLAPDWYSVTVTDEATDCQVHQNVQVFEDTICYVRISGYVYLDDVEQDCQVDAATLPAPYQQVQLSDGQITFTNVDGYYEFTTDAGNYEVSVQYAALYEDLCSDPIMVNASTWGEAYTGNDFYLKLAINSDLQLKVIKFNARPGFQQDVRICLMNVGAVPRSGTLSFVHPEIQEYLSSSPVDDTYDMNTQTATWDYVDIPPGAIWVYTAKLLTPIGTALGTELAYGFYTDPIDNDITPENNNIECSIVVTGSYDPNDKAVAPAGIGEEGIISMADSLLSYTIRFQNTGTDTAFTVLLRDTLDSDLLVETVRPGPSSHPYSLTVKEGNILEFLFENILLPDSTVNEEASNGFVIFDVFIRDDAPYGTVVENTAGIYFDFNPPIITNTVVNTIQMINALPDIETNDIAIELQPNPSRDAAWLNFTLEKAERVDISLLSIRGEKIKMLMANEQKQAGAHRLDLADLDLAAGVYFIQVETRSGGSGVVKLVRL